MAVEYIEKIDGKTQPMSRELIEAKLRLQIKEALSPKHQAEAQKALGADIADKDIFLYFVKHHGAGFHEDFVKSASALNIYYAGKELVKDPTPEDLWEYFENHVPEEQLAHHHEDQSEP